MWSRQQDTRRDPCHCHSDLILGTLPRDLHICRSEMTSTDQRKWLVGFGPVTSWRELHPFLLPSHPTHLWVRDFKRGSIYRFTLQVIDRHLEHTHFNSLHPKPIISLWNISTLLWGLCNQTKMSLKWLFQLWIGSNTNTALWPALKSKVRFKFLIP